MADRERRYEHLYGQELQDLMQKAPVAWLPLGILEHHGEHLPWGLDGLKAHGVCMRLAEKLGGVVLPAAHLAGIHGDPGEDADEADFRRRHGRIGDFMYREATFRTFLRETFDSLTNIGFRVIVAYTGHYPSVQTRVLKQAADAFTAGGGAVVIPFWEPLACGDGDHGGKYETSIYMALEPGGARLEAVREDKTGRPGYYRGRNVQDEASAAFGEQALAQVAEFLGKRVCEALGLE